MATLLLFASLQKEDCYAHGLVVGRKRDDGYEVRSECMSAQQACNGARLSPSLLLLLSFFLSYNKRNRRAHAAQITEETLLFFTRTFA